MITWMEENPEELRGKQCRWHKDVKDEVFHSEEHITVKKINDKVSNMKRQWKEAKVLQGKSGWGVEATEDDNQKLERKCPFFNRLDGIWGTRPRVRAVTRMESASASTPARVIVSESESVSPSPPSPSPSHQSSPARSCQYSPARSPRALSIAFEDINDGPNQQLGQHSTAPQSSTQRLGLTSRRSTQQSLLSHPLPKRGGEKRNILESIKELVDSERTPGDTYTNKRLKLECEVEMEKIRSHERIVQIQAAEKLKSDERIAQIQADSQVKQMEVVAHIMQQVIAVLRPAPPG